MAHRRICFVRELATATAPICFHGNRSWSNIWRRALHARHSVRARGILVGCWSTLDSKEGVPVPIGAGDLLGNGRKGFVSLPVPFKPFRNGGDDMGFVPPLSDHLGTQSDLPGNAGSVWIAAAHGFGDLAKAPLRRIREPAVEF